MKCTMSPKDPMAKGPGTNKRLGREKESYEVAHLSVHKTKENIQMCNRYFPQDSRAQISNFSIHSDGISYRSTGDKCSI